MSARIWGRTAAAAIAFGLLIPSPSAAADGVSLRSFAAQQVHVAAIADRIGAASANRCEKPRMLTGMLLHDLSAYDPAVRPAVASAFSLSVGVGVLQIVAGSAADRSGLHIDDEILAIGSQSIGDPSAAYARRKSYARIERFSALLDAALNHGTAELVVRRAGTVLHIPVTAERGCGGQLALTNSSEVNAWSDGDHVMLTTAMMRLAQSDDEIAFVIAHEMAHNILGHSRSGSSGIFGIGQARQSELAADRLAVQLMSSAGYQPGGGVTFLERVQRRFWWAVSLDHPGFGRRIKEVNSAMAAIAEARRPTPPVRLSGGSEPHASLSVSGSLRTELAATTGIAAGPIQFADASAGRSWAAPRLGRTNCLP